MQKFILISKRITGWIEYYFNKSGVLTGYQVKAEMSKEDMVKVAELLPASVDGLKRMADKTGAEIRTDHPELTFERWYELFDVQRNRDRAAKLWAQLSEKDRLRCFISLEGYKRYCKNNPWYTPQYPDTWLRNRQFETEWDKLASTNRVQP